MKTIGLITCLVLILTSCGSVNQFNKQKFTKLKKVETVHDQVETIPSEAAANSDYEEIEEKYAIAEESETIHAQEEIRLTKGSTEEVLTEIEDTPIGTVLIDNDLDCIESELSNPPTAPTDDTDLPEKNSKKGRAFRNWGIIKLVLAILAFPFGFAGLGDVEAYFAFFGISAFHIITAIGLFRLAKKNDGFKKFERSENQKKGNRFQWLGALMMLFGGILSAGIVTLAFVFFYGATGWIVFFISLAALIFIAGIVLGALVIKKGRRVKRTNE